MTKFFVAMIAMFAISFFTAESQAAAKANVFCKTIQKDGKMKIQSALSEDGHYDCAYHLAHSKACFTGARSAAIALINNDSFNWDEEYLEEAHFMGKNEISYKWVDGPNELSSKESMSPCAKDYFKDPTVGPFVNN